MIRTLARLEVGCLFQYDKDISKAGSRVFISVQRVCKNISTVVQYLFLHDKKMSNAGISVL